MLCDAYTNSAAESLPLLEPATSAPALCCPLLWQVNYTQIQHCLD